MIPIKSLHPNELVFTERVTAQKRRLVTRTPGIEKKRMEVVADEAQAASPPRTGERAVTTRVDPREDKGVWHQPCDACGTLNPRPEGGARFPNCIFCGRLLASRACWLFDWNCLKCGDMIFAKRDRCRRCRSRPDDWKCTGCNFVNFASRASCKGCDASKFKPVHGAYIKPLSDGKTQTITIDYPPGNGGKPVIVTTIN